MSLGLGKSAKQPEDEDATLEENGGSDGTPSADNNSGVDGGSSVAAAAPAVEDQGDGARRHLPTFRPAFLDDTAPDQAAVPAMPPPEGDAFFVSVTRDGSAEIHSFDDPARVQAFVEQLLEKDVPEEDVAAFSGHRLSLKVSHRPVVKLSSAQED